MAKTKILYTTVRTTRVTTIIHKQRTTVLQHASGLSPPTAEIPIPAITQTFTKTIPTDVSQSESYHSTETRQTKHLTTNETSTVKTSTKQTSLELTTVVSATTSEEAWNFTKTRGPTTNTVHNASEDYRVNSTNMSDYVSQSAGKVSHSGEFRLM